MDRIVYKSSFISWKLVVGLVAVILTIVGYNKGWIPGHTVNKSEVPQIPEQFSGNAYKKVSLTNVTKEPLPAGDELAGKMFLTVNNYDWHATIASLYCAGGERTLESSLCGKEGLVIKNVHQDNTNTSIKQFGEKVVEYKKSGGKTGGNLAFTIMANTSVSLVEPLQKYLKTIDPSYQAVAIDLWGKSDGEDQGIGSKEILKNPEFLRGKVACGVYDDGDIGLIQQYCKKVNIPFNFDYKTYNRNALNVANVDDFMLASKQFIQNTVYDSRPVVDDDGKPTGEMSGPLHSDILASWTPADRNVLIQLSKADPTRFKGLATFTSTGGGEERKVMPAVLIVFNKYYEANLDKFGKFSYAVHKAAEQIDAHPEALQKTMEIATAIYGIWDENGKAADTVKERIKAFRGYPAPGNPLLHIGGSAVFGFKDAMNMVGMTDSGAGDDLENSTYASVYRTFGNLTIQKFPEKDVKQYVPFGKFFDPRALRAAYSRAKDEGGSSVSTELVASRDYDKQTSGAKIGSNSYSVTFKTGSSSLDANGLKVMKEIQDAYASSEYSISIVGHADRTGPEDRNEQLSLDRAQAAQDYLVAKNAKDFGGKRIKIDGKGSTQPPDGVDPNYKGECSQCRRIQLIILR